MSKKHEPDNFEQMSIFGIMNLLDNTENTLSSDDISKIIDKLSDAKRKRESIEAKKRRQEEREKRERDLRSVPDRLHLTRQQQECFHKGGLHLHLILFSKLYSESLFMSFYERDDLVNNKSISRKCIFR